MFSEGACLKFRLFLWKGGEEASREDLPTLEKTCRGNVAREIRVDYLFVKYCDSSLCYRHYAAVIEAEISK